MKLNRHSRLAATATMGALALTLAACGSDNATGDSSSEGSTSTDSSMAALSGELNGAGASSQESAMGAWRAGFQAANPDVVVNYDPVGSGGGRTQFLDGSVAFAGSDAALDEDELAQAADRLASGQNQQGAQAFATVQHAIAHRYPEAGGRIQRNPGIQRGFQFLRL